MLKKLNVHIEKLILLAKSQLGTVEDPPESNNVIYNTVYFIYRIVMVVYCCFAIRSFGCILF